MVLSSAASAQAAGVRTAGPASPGAQVSAGGPVAIEVCGEGPREVRPSSITLTCADDGEMAVDLHWGSWSAGGARATGQVQWNACSATCRAPSLRLTAAEVTLGGARQVTGQGLVFTTVTLRVTGPTPAGFHRSAVFDDAPLAAGSPERAQPSQLPPASGPALPAAASGTLSYSHIEGFWDLAKGPSSQADVAAAITGAESSFEPGIIQQGVAYCDAGSDRAGWGLWQITCGNEVPAYGTDFQLLDPWNNAEAAVSLYDNAGGFSPWTTYETGAYRQFLQTNTPADTNLTDPGEYVQSGSTPPGTPSSPAANPGSTYGPPIPGSVPTSGEVSGGLRFNGYEAMPNGLVLNAKGFGNPADAVVFAKQSGASNELVSRYQLADGYVAYGMDYGGAQYCLNLKGNSTAIRTQLIFYRCSLSAVAPNEQFRQAVNTPSGYGSGYHLIVPALAQSMCANAKGGSTSDADVILYPCNSQSNEAWSDQSS